MARSTDRILTTHAGSLPRPPALMSFLERERDGESFDQSEFEECLRASVAEVVRAQVGAGIDIVSDGEFGKTINWYIYVNERLDGLEHHPDQAGQTSSANPTSVASSPSSGRRTQREPAVTRGDAAGSAPGPCATRARRRSREI